MTPYQFQSHAQVQVQGFALTKHMSFSFEMIPDQACNTESHYQAAVNTLSVMIKKKNLLICICHYKIPPPWLYASTMYKYVEESITVLTYSLV